MADGDSKNNASNLSDERFKYIGFDVFPGKAGDIFKSDEERTSLVERVKAKLSHKQGEVRERCTLIEKRVSGVEKAFLTAAAVFLLIAFLLPWFSGYIPVSYQELGTLGGQKFFFVSQSDEAEVGVIAATMTTRHDRMLRHKLSLPAEEEAVPVEEEMPPVEEEAAVPVDTSMTEAGGEGAAEGEATTTAETEPDATTDEPETSEADDIETVSADEAVEGEEEVEEEEDSNVVPDEIDVIFVDIPELDMIHGMDDLRNHVVGRLVYNGRTGRKQLDYGADRAMPQLSEAILTRAQVNDSISAAVTDSLRQAAIEMAAEGDTVMNVDSIFYAGPVLVNDKPVKELAQKGIINDAYSMSGLAMLGAIGTYGSMVFGGGIVLKITGVLFLLYVIACIILALSNLYVLYGVKKKTDDDYALHLKKMLKLNWIPVLVWLGIFILSFVGSTYGAYSGPEAEFVAQVGDAYGVGAFIGLASFGMYITLAGFLILALKGKEI
jgi:hypothetical protein